MALSPRGRKALLTTALIVSVLLLTGAALQYPVQSHLRALSMLMRYSDPKADGFETSFARHPVRVEENTTVTPDGPLRYRLYIPADVPNPTGILLLHGIHHLGIDDPRLMDIARALADTGVEIMTPELQDLADYRVTARTIDVIGRSAEFLSTQLHETKVGLIGVSFAGGLSLMAAARPEYAHHIGYVLAIGAHDDMARVARFFADNLAEKPDGTDLPFHAHEYGALILAYSHVEDFFSPKDAPIAREALRRWLWEEPDAMTVAEGLSRAGRERFDQLLYHRDQLQQKFLKEIVLHKDEMDAVSPHGHLADLKVPVYLLHGAGDTVIPATETMWLSKDVPQQYLRGVLVSKALIHVNMQDQVTWSDKWALMDLMAHVLENTDQLRGGR